MDGLKKLWTDLSALDGREVARRTGAQFDEGSYLVPFLGSMYLVDPDARSIKASNTESSELGAGGSTNRTLAILTYLVVGEMRPRVRTWITEKELPGGSVFFQGPHVIPVQPIIGEFGKNVAAFVIRGVSLGGVQSEFGDGSVEFPVLPGLQMCLALWEADDEFPAACTVMFDKSFSGMFALDVVLALVSAVVEQIVAA